MARTIKRYDKAYFDRWYRRRRILRPADLQRSAALAVAITEYVLGRPLRSVLDVGAGEGRWQPVLNRLRPRARYAGVEPSPWAVRHWGIRRNLRQGSLDTLDQLGLAGPFDLIVMSDVMHYLPTGVLRDGLPCLVELLGGVAFLPTFTRYDEIEGDRSEFQRRSASQYRQLLRGAGLVPVGLNGWISKHQARELTELERR